MKRIATWMLVAGFVTSAVVAESAPTPELTAGQIVEKNMAARGGAEAWHKVETMVWVGHIEGANAPDPGLPFVHRTTQLAIYDRNLRALARKVKAEFGAVCG